MIPELSHVAKVNGCAAIIVWTTIPVPPIDQSQSTNLQTALAQWMAVRGLGHHREALRLEILACLVSPAKE
jgi:hypothetical protein